jgi:hypothetical protein
MGQTYTLTATGEYLLNVAPDNVSPDGICLQFTESGTASIVLAKNTAPPGSAVALTNVQYLNGSLAVQSAGTAVTASGLAYISAADAALPIYGTLTLTSGTLVVNVSPANIGSGGGGGGPVGAADVTAGTFGASTGEVGDYTFPVDVAVTDVLTADELVATTSITGTLVTAAQPNVTSLGTLTSPVATRLNVGAAPAAAISDTTITKAVAAIADNVATTVLTVTIPNAAHNAVLRVSAAGVIGAGGAIGAGEACASNSYDITFVRTAGVNAVADISTAYGVNAANVAGATTCTAALTVGSVGGAVDAANTFAIQITVVKNDGASDNHTAYLTASLLNKNAAGISIA